jgi:hypothetical protein
MKKIAFSHRLLHHTTTIEEGDDIVAITFFATEPQKRRMQPFCATKPSKKVTEGVVFFFFATIEPQKKILL